MTIERVPLEPERLFGPDQPCFGCGPRHPHGLRLEPYVEGDAVCAEFTPRPEHQGPPGIMHGGLTLTLADELGAWVVLGLKRRFGFTTAVEARLLRPVRIGLPVHGRGTITEDSGRALRLSVTLAQGDADVLRGTLTFALLDREAAERLLDAPLPETWVPFAG